VTLASLARRVRINSISNQGVLMLAIKRQIDAVATDAKLVADALAHHAARASEPALRGQMSRLETALRDFALAVSVTPVPTSLS
jgi:hypothetical protein